MNYKFFYKSNYFISTIILITIFTLISFSNYRSWPAHDELVTISTFTDIRTIALRYIPNNHVITSLIGLISNTLFGVNLFLLRLTSFISLLKLTNLLSF